MKVTFKNVSMQKIRALWQKSPHVHVYPSASSRYGVRVDADADYYLRQSVWDRILNKYRPVISELVGKIKDNHGKKSSGV